MTKCNTIQQRLLLHLDGDLSEADSSAFNDHLLDCKECSLLKERMYRQYLATDISFPRKDDPYFFTKVEARLAKRKAENELPLFRMRPAMLAAAVAVPLMIGIWLGYSTYSHQSLQNLSGELASEMHQMLTTPGYATLEAFPYGYTE